MSEFMSVSSVYDAMAARFSRYCWPIAPQYYSPLNKALVYITCNDRIDFINKYQIINEYYEVEVKAIFKGFRLCSISHSYGISFNDLRIFAWIIKTISSDHNYNMHKLISGLRFSYKHQFLGCLMKTKRY